MHLTADLLLCSAMLALLWVGFETRGLFTRRGSLALLLLWLLLAALLYRLHQHAGDRFDQEQREALPAVHAAAPTLTNRSRSAGPVA